MENFEKFELRGTEKVIGGTKPAWAGLGKPSGIGEGKPAWAGQGMPDFSEYQEEVEELMAELPEMIEEIEI